MSARKVPSLRHHKARGLAVVTLGGKDFYCGKFGSPESRREYDRVVGEWLAAGRPEVVGAPHRLTVAELLVRYMRFAEGYLPRSNVTSFRERISGGEDRQSRDRMQP